MRRGGRRILPGRAALGAARPCRRRRRRPGAAPAATPARPPGPGAGPGGPARTAGGWPGGPAGGRRGGARSPGWGSSRLPTRPRGRGRARSRPPANSSVPPSSPWASGRSRPGAERLLGRPHRHHPVDPEQPLGDRLVAPAGQVPVAGGAEHHPRVDLAVGQLPRDDDQYSISTRWPVAAALASSCGVSAGSPSRSTETRPASSWTRSSWSAGGPPPAWPGPGQRPCSATSGRASRARPARYSPAASRQVSLGALAK